MADQLSEDETPITEKRRRMLKAFFEQVNIDEQPQRRRLRIRRLARPHNWRSLILCDEWVEGSLVLGLKGETEPGVGGEFSGFSVTISLNPFGQWSCHYCGSSGDAANVPVIIACVHAIALLMLVNGGHPMPLPETKDEPNA